MDTTKLQLFKWQLPWKWFVCLTRGFVSFANCSCSFRTNLVSFITFQEPPDFPYSPNKFLSLVFFTISYSSTALEPTSNLTWEGGGCATDWAIRCCIIKIEIRQTKVKCSVKKNYAPLLSMARMRPQSILYSYYLAKDLVSRWQVCLVSFPMLLTPDLVNASWTEM